MIIQENNGIMREENQGECFRWLVISEKVPCKPRAGRMWSSLLGPLQPEKRTTLCKDLKVSLKEEFPAAFTNTECPEYCVSATVGC